MKRLRQVLSAAAFVLAISFALGGCAIFEKTPEEPQEPVSYGSAIVNYHYQYDVIIEEYMQEKYTVVIGRPHEITELYTPPEKLGYAFLGWTREEGGAGECISTPFSITGSGGTGTQYDLYAKYEPIAFTVTYELDGGINDPENPDEWTGKKTLKDPTKEGYDFEGWYRDADFDELTTVLQLKSNDQTSFTLYAKWERFYTLTYQTDTEDVRVVGDLEHRRYRADSEDFTVELTSEYKANYLFLGWTYDGQSEPIMTAEIAFAKGSTGDRVYTAHYRKATLPVDVEGLEVINRPQQGEREITVPEGVDEIVVPDIFGVGYGNTYQFVSTARIRYRGDRQPTIYHGAHTTVVFEKIA